MHDLTCSCGSDDLSVCSTLPVFIYLNDGEVRRIALADPAALVTEGIVRCLSCERLWMLVDVEEEFIG